MSGAASAALPDDLAECAALFPLRLLIGFASEDNWLYQLESDPRFLHRIERARNSLREGCGVRIEDVE